MSTPDKPQVAIFILTPVNSELTEVNTKSTNDIIHSYLSHVQFCGKHLYIDKTIEIVQVLYIKVKSIYTSALSNYVNHCILKYNACDNCLHLKMNNKSISKQSKSIHCSSHSDSCPILSILLEEPDWPPPQAAQPLDYQHGQLGM